ncbi:MAG: polysaccharide pyruvyl transferase family protein [Gemmatimonadaceae bacterium]
MNVGDAAILQGEIHALREVFGESVRIDVSEQTPTVAARLYPEIAFHAGLHVQHAHWPRWRSHGGVASLRKRRTRLAVRLLATAPAATRALLSAEQRAHLDLMAAADVVVATGGTYFVEHYDFTAKADELLAAHALGKPTFLFTQSMGPFKRPKSRLTMERIVAGSGGVFVRDEKSKRHLDEIGAPMDHVHVHADAAFALATPDLPRVPSRGRPRVAISVRRWSHFRAGSGEDVGERYRRAVADAARTLVRDGAEVTFLSTCQGVREYWTDDSKFAAQLVADLLPGEAHVRVDTAFRSPTALAEELRGYDVAIATRMHFAILALCVATPVVAIAYEFKSRELLTAMGHAAWAFDIEDVSAEGLVRATRHALSGGDTLRASIVEQVRAYRSDAIGPAKRIQTALR